MTPTADGKVIRILRARVANATETCCAEVQRSANNEEGVSYEPCDVSAVVTITTLAVPLSRAYRRKARAPFCAQHIPRRYRKTLGWEPWGEVQP